MVTPEQARRNMVLASLDRPRNGWALLTPRRREVEAIRAEDMARIREIDATVAPLVVERRRLARRVVRANRALTFTPSRRARPPHWELPAPPPRPFEDLGTLGVAGGAEDDGDAGGEVCPPLLLRELTSRELKEEVVLVLRDAGEALGVSEIVDVLALEGVRPVSANASQAVWNALRSAIRTGEVWKAARDRYEAVPPGPTIGCVSDQSPVNLSREGPPETVLAPEPPEAVAALREAMKAPDAIRRDAISEVVRRWPTYLEAWARLGELGRDEVESYACFRVGYHRGLDRLRQSGWRGSGYVRWEHEANRGFLLALQGLQRAAADIGEDAEAERCAQFLAQLDPSLG